MKGTGDPFVLHFHLGIVVGRMQYAPTSTDEGSRSILRTFTPIRGYSEGIYNRYLRKRLKDPARTFGLSSPSGDARWAYAIRPYPNGRKITIDSFAIHPLPGMLGGRIRYAPTLTGERSRSILLPFIPIRGYSAGLYNRYLRERLKDPT